MGVTDASIILEAIQTGGIIGILVFIVAGGARGWWVYGSHFHAMRDDRDRARQEVERWQNIALRTLDVTEGLVERARRRGDPEE